MVDTDDAIYTTFLGLVTAAAEPPLDGSGPCLSAATGEAAQAFTDFFEGRRTRSEEQRFEAWSQGVWANIEFASTDEAARFVARTCLDNPSARIPLLEAFKAQLDAVSDKAVAAMGRLTADYLNDEHDDSFHLYVDILKRVSDEDFDLFVSLVACVVDAFDQGIIDGELVDVWTKKPAEHAKGRSEGIHLVVLSNKDPYTCYGVGPDQNPLDIDLARAISVLTLFKTARLGQDMTPTKHHTADSPSEALTIPIATAQNLQRYLPARPRREH
jgi:hypothetical protein